jgi:hypothetical protein
MSATLDIRLKKTNKTYNEGNIESISPILINFRDKNNFLKSSGDLIKGVVVINANSDIKHDGLTLNAEGFVGMQVSNKSTGVFEAFYNSVNKPIILFTHTIELLAPGKISIGITEVEFEFMLESRKGGESSLFEAYSGVFICVNYFIKADLKRKFLAKDSQGKVQFFVQNHVS